jgi:hypothetical protein
MPGGAPAFVVGESGLTLPASVEGTAAPAVQVLAPDVRLASSGSADRFGVEAVPVTLAPGVRVTASTVVDRFAPAAFNPDHTRFVARSPHAKPMAVNMYSGWWSLVVCVFVTVIVSLFTRPKPDHELTNLVMGLTPLPPRGDSRWYERPALWATVILAVLVAVNLLFW